MPSAPAAMILGRAAECDRLVDAIAGDGVVVVTGEAGIGKTALVRAAVAAAGRRLVEGGAFATLSSMPYLPLRLALGAPVAGEPVRVAVRVEAAVQDAVLFIDDVQWADHDTLAVLRLLVGRVAMIVAARTRVEWLADPENAPLTTIDLGPLDDEVAASIIRQARPDVAEADLRRVLRRAGGNPLVLEELARDGRESPTIARAITSLVDAASTEARHRLRMLAIADRPLPAGAVGPVLGELLGLGVVVHAGDRVAIRHALIAEAMVGGMPADERRAVHREVAALADDPLDAAIHLALAGRGDEAIATAEVALEDAGDLRRRFALLRVVADAADGPDAWARRLAAARAAYEIDDLQAIVDLLDRPDPGDPGLLAIRDGLLARALGDLGRRADADAAIARGLDRKAMDPTLEAAHILGVEQAVAQVNAGNTAEAVAIVDALDVECLLGDVSLRHRRGNLRSILQFLQGMPPDRDSMHTAVDDAIASRNAAAAVASCINLHAVILATDGPGPALQFTREQAGRLEAAGLEAWRLRTESIQTLAFLGSSVEAVVTADEILERPTPFGNRAWALVLRAEALCQLGRFDEAAASVVAATPILTDDFLGRGSALTASAGAALWAGKPRDALADAAEALTLPSHYAANHMLPGLIRAWAQVELGRTPDPLPDTPPSWLADASRAEWSGLRARSSGLPSREAFELAATRWDGRLAFRATLCRWAAAEGAYRQGDHDAVAMLQAALEEAEHFGFEPLARRVRRSLRVAGVRTAPARPAAPATALLTSREREILGLVGGGLSNIEVARRVGLGRPTVARIMSTAMVKLGASTRAQAVALAEAHAA